MNQFGLTEAALKVIVGKIAPHPEIEKAVIFGSRAIGNYKNGSDVDIALFGSDVSFKLTADISAELNEHTTQPYFFDLLNFNSIDNDDLKRHVNDFGKVIFERSLGSH
ncbi:MAG: nucleotidyltransferase domain-containing protein [Bacteroidetes bacterium]|nr:nucleotidyltransferase domain-containing protein [Bacteroidota bacterium]